jgi:hypothetical protein
MEQKSEIETLIYTETEKRLAVMEKPDYVYPDRIGKNDIAGMIILFSLSLFLILLCMTGVIL